MVKVCDVVTINAPLHPETDNLFNGNLLSKMKRGACLVSAAAVRFAIGTQSSAPSKAPWCTRDTRPEPGKSSPQCLFWGRPIGNEYLIVDGKPIAREES